MRPRLEGVGEAKPSQIFLFLVVIAGEAGNHYEKTSFVEGLWPSTPPRCWEFESGSATRGTPTAYIKTVHLCIF